MLNISHNNVDSKVDLKAYKATKHIFSKHYYKYFNRFLLAIAITGLIMLFLPWTQNISGQGLVTTLKPSQRPQTIQSQIPGRIEEWFVQEGDYVEKGDTILRISEIKVDYFDDKLIERTSDQINAKSSSVEAYQSKVDALERQIVALKQEQENEKLMRNDHKNAKAELEFSDMHGKERSIRLTKPDRTLPAPHSTNDSTE